MGNTRGLFKNIGDSKVKFHEQMGMIKDKKGKDFKAVPAYFGSDFCDPVSDVATLILR